MSNDAAAERRDGQKVRPTQPREARHDDDRHEYSERCTVGRGGKADQEYEGDRFSPVQRGGGEQQKVRAQHGRAGEDVGEQDASEPRQRGHGGECGNDADEHYRAIAEVVRPQHEGDDPHRGRRLQ
jgi:hypothetical protein